MSFSQGDKVGRWKLLEQLDFHKGPSSRRWRCICECGKFGKPYAYTLKNGSSKSCGCLRVLFTKKHGQVGLPFYSKWLRIRQWCNNPKHPLYGTHGAIGVKVCDSWDKSFEAFAKDVGKQPSDKHTLERIDVTGDYEPGNTRWITRSQRRPQKTSPRSIRIAKFVKLTGLPKETIKARVRYGWSDERLLEPLHAPSLAVAHAKVDREFKARQALRDESERAKLEKMHNQSLETQKKNRRKKSRKPAARTPSATPAQSKGSKDNPKPSSKSFRLRTFLSD